jgi:hypothetical protein
LGLAHRPLVERIGARHSAGQQAISCRRGAPLDRETFSSQIRVDLVARQTSATLAAARAHWPSNIELPRRACSRAPALETAALEAIVLEQSGWPRHCAHGDYRVEIWEEREANHA